LFIELAKPDTDGFSRSVKIEEFVGKYSVLKLGNGGSWCRDDGGLGKHFNIQRKKHVGRIVEIALHGRKKQPIEKPIPAKIFRKIRKQSCTVLATGKVEVDHKDGRRDDPRLTDPKTIKESDFQPLSKAANNAKRQHCKICRKTGNRFDAKRLGYRLSQFKGNGIYRGSCIGCYWHDPKRFNYEVSG